MPSQLVVSDDERMARLVEALLLVAADADQQIPALSALRAIAEQIRNGDPPGVLLDEELAAEHVIAEPVCARIQRIDELFDRLVEDEDPFVWTERALLQSDVWRQLRTEAREVLRELGVPLRAPRIPLLP